MSDLNTDLGVRHPIMTALNAIQSLGSTPELSTNETSSTGAINAPGAVSQAVNDIGFGRYFAGNSLVGNNLNERLQQIFERQPEDFADFTTLRGENVQIAASTFDGQVVLQAIASTATGEALLINDVTVLAGNDVSQAHVSDGQASVNLDTSHKQLALDIGLENGYRVLAEIELLLAERDSEIGLEARQIESKTFTAQTESLVFAKDVEASKLLKAIGG